MKLTKSYSKIVSIITKSFKNDHVEVASLTNNLDYLINNYFFQKIDNVYQTDNKKIYLYNTHNLEKYNDGTTIKETTKILKDNLVKLGINVIQEERNTSELLHIGLSYYEISRLFLKDIINQKDIAYFVDVHRDSVKNTKVTIDGKDYAKIMFVLGLKNENYEENKKLLNEMNNYLNEKYPGLSRGIYEKNGDNVDGVYNQDLSSNVILIEIGGIENNIEEINNSTEILALMFYHVLGD